MVNTPIQELSPIQKKEPDLENVETESKKIERLPSKKNKILKKTVVSASADSGKEKDTKDDSPHPGVQKSETLEQIEDIMEEDLEDVFQELPSEIKIKLKEKGEETAVEIEGMLFKVKLHSKKIFKLLFGWLAIIPGLNKYFLKQEAKLKTDEIMHIKEDIDRSRDNQI